MLPATTLHHPWAVEHPFAVFVRHDRHPQPLRVEAHDWFELVVVLAGRREHQWPSHVRTLVPGEAALSPPWEPHAWRSLEPDTVLASVHFPPQFLGSEAFDGISWLAPFACDPEDRPVVSTEAGRAEVLALARALVRYRSDTVWYIAAGEVPAPDDRPEEAVAIGYALWPGEPGLPPGWEQHVRLHSLLLLLQLFQEWEHRAEASRLPAARATHLARVLPALHLCADRPPQQRVRVAEAAGACHLSESRFRGLFRQTMHVSFGEFELRRRLGRAVDLLLTSETSLARVAQACGFTDASHLRRRLSKHYQTTPAALRRQQG